MIFDGGGAISANKSFTCLHSVIFIPPFDELVRATQPVLNSLLTACFFFSKR